MACTITQEKLSPAHTMLRILRPYVHSKTPPPSAVAIGNFDGLHLGHIAILNAAKKTGLTSATLTFEPHPSRLFRPGAHTPRLYTLKDKIALFEMAEIPTVFLQQFNTRFANTTAQEFVTEYLAKTIRARHVIVGEDFIFGHKRGGDTALLKSLCAAHNIAVTIVPPQLAPDGKPYSSTRIRHLISEGDITGANALLGRAWSISARTREGQKLGRTIGFPTLNMRWPEGLVTLPFGVYAGHVNGTIPAVMNYGIRPTISAENAPLLEVHLLETPKAIPTYGERLRVCFAARIRPEMKFSGLDELKTQIAKDCALAKDILNRKA